MIDTLENTCHECDGSGMSDCPDCYGGDMPPRRGKCKTCGGARIVDCYVCTKDNPEIGRALVPAPASVEELPCT